MHYTSGLAGLASLGGAGFVAGQAGATSLARVLLEACGALFALYLVLMLALTVSGQVMRRRAASAPATGSPARPAPTRGHSR